jgi:hypothetical protein
VAAHGANEVRPRQLRRSHHQCAGSLQRDPNDKLGNSIVAVSGLRLSTKALADLSQQNNLNGSLRSEAQDWPSCCAPALVKMLVPGARKPTPAPATSPAKKTRVRPGVEEQQPDQQHRSLRRIEIRSRYG